MSSRLGIALMATNIPLAGEDGTPRNSAWLPLPMLIVAAIFLGRSLPAWAYMWSISFAMYFGLKWLTLWGVSHQVKHSRMRSLQYLLLWPGMDARGFLDERVQPTAPRSVQWFGAILKTVFGVVLLWKIARLVVRLSPLLCGWVGLLGLIFVLHFGTFHILALMWQWRGVQAKPIMNAPALSHSLTEFWGKRWNLGFRQLSHHFVFQPLQRTLGAAPASIVVFVLSGAIHELAISVPARGGYGLPTAYFALQGAGVLLEHSSLGRIAALQRGWRGRVFMAVMTAGPAFWLFHPPFVNRVILPFLRVVRAI